MISRWSLARKSLCHFWRSHLGVLLGTAISSTVLVGALGVGDSVRNSLRQQAVARIGQVNAVLASGDRFFQQALVSRLDQALPNSTLAGLVMTRGVVATPDASARANRVQVLGIDSSFFQLSAQAAPELAPGSREVVLNQRLADHLRVSDGDSVILRVEIPSGLPRDMVLGGEEDALVALRAQVKTVVGPDHFGRFALTADPVPPFNAYVSADWLRKEWELEERANAILVGGDPVAPAVLEQALAEQWTLEDGELEFRPHESLDLVEVKTRRVFLDPAVLSAANRSAEAGIAVMTYFVNELSVGERTTPYSMVSALTRFGTNSQSSIGNPAAPSVLEKLTGDDLAIQSWLAEDLAAAPGDSLTLRYYVINEQRRLQEEQHTFQVRHVVEREGWTADPELMPDFPGLVDAENCRDWEPGIPVDLDRIRDKDEAYWDDHRGTPKAFLSWDTATRLWSNRFGGCTALRVNASQASAFRELLRDRLTPRDLGLFFQDVRQAAMQTTAATDFGSLFLGLSLFLIGAAGLLTVLLFSFSVTQRSSEIGTLRCLGFRRARILGLLLREAALVAVLGAALGIPTGLLYTRGILTALNSIWSDAVAGTILGFAPGPMAVGVGALSAVVVALIAIAATLRGVLKQADVSLLTANEGVVAPAETLPPKPSRVSLAIAISGLASAAAVCLSVDAAAGTAAAGAYFGAGAGCLIGLLATFRWGLGRTSRSTKVLAHSISQLGRRSSARRPGRSLATVALLATGVFLVLSVGVYRLDVPERGARDSGTGGFALWAETTLPVHQDLNSESARENYGLEDFDWSGVSFVPFRVRPGDDASCLNLNLSQHPTLLGVDPGLLASRNAFVFQDVWSGSRATDSPWELLEEGGDGWIPAIGDQASVTWALHKKLGDVLQYQDERGHAWPVKIVGTLRGSILQGNLVVAEQDLEAAFPTVSGSQRFLIDAPWENREEVAQQLTRGLEDRGMEVVTTQQRLAEFSAVQNSYLTIFQVLGALGLLLGSVGLWMVVLRNVVERRGEMALLDVIGFRRPQIRQLLVSEHFWLLLAGLVSGTVAALLAIRPALRGTASTSPFDPWTWGMVAGVVVLGTLWVVLASRFAVRGNPWVALQRE